MSLDRWKEAQVDTQHLVLKPGNPEAKEVLESCSRPRTLAEERVGRFGGNELLVVMKRGFRVATVICAFLSVQTLSGAIITVQVSDVIQPIVAEYAIKGISQAEAERANAVILRLS